MKYSGYFLSRLWCGYLLIFLRHFSVYRPLFLTVLKRSLIIENPLFTDVKFRWLSKRPPHQRWAPDTTPVQESTTAGGRPGRRMKNGNYSCLTEQVLLSRYLTRTTLQHVVKSGDLLTLCDVPGFSKLAVHLRHFLSTFPRCPVAHIRVGVLHRVVSLVSS